ncbi:unnamed protein product [Mytilus coruscus]|uniref:Transglutaminase-like domain-containing protein n=1 Tax=Mytilus coruscus TaxID=42192 RepID=A0A6J8A7J0_MYTCO|nr:unnamed protein product [Mytilus coruscus]
MGCNSSHQESSANSGNRSSLLTPATVTSTDTHSAKSERRVQFNKEVQIVRSPANVSSVRFSIPGTPSPEVEDVRRPYPPQKKRRDLIPDSSVFKKIDENALKAPNYKEPTVLKLAQYLRRECSSDLEKIRAFYIWITNNVHYDTESHFSGRSRPVDALTVMKCKVSVCEGYANLFAELCNCSNIHAKIIPGFAKGFGHTPAKRFNYRGSINHTWNAVYVDDEWHFMECTWGAGYIDKNRRFVWRYNENYFLPDPETMIFTHFPYFDPEVDESKLWQLLPKSIDLKTFNLNIKPTNKSLEWGIEYESHKSAVIDCAKELVVKFKTDLVKLCDTSVYLMDIDGNMLQHHAIVLNGPYDNAFKAIIRPPKVGGYSVKLFATTSPDNKVLSLINEYFVRCREIVRRLDPYPEYYGYYGPVHGYLDFGISRGADIRPFYEVHDGFIDLIIPVDYDVDVTARLTYSHGELPNMDDFVMIQAIPKSMVVNVKFPKSGYYKLTLSFKNEKGNYREAINCLINCVNPSKPCYPYPKTLRHARELKCHLIQPLSQILPCNKNITIKITCENMIAVMVRKHKFKRIGKKYWDFTFETPNMGERIVIYGLDEEEHRMPLYEFITA